MKNYDWDERKEIVFEVLDMTLDELTSVKESLEELQDRVCEAISDIRFMTEYSRGYEDADLTGKASENVEKASEMNCADCDQPCDEDEISDGESLAIEMLKAIFECLMDLCERGEAS